MLLKKSRLLPRALSLKWIAGGGVAVSLIILAEELGINEIITIPPFDKINS